MALGAPDQTHLFMASANLVTLRYGSCRSGVGSMHACMCEHAAHVKESLADCPGCVQIRYIHPRYTARCHTHRPWACPCTYWRMACPAARTTTAAKSGLTAASPRYTHLSPCHLSPLALDLAILAVWFPRLHACIHPFMHGAVC